ncbi:hypothetical protein Glove_64g101 [Diversispora epigaea]|uniref:BTB domain-containing protein n=1 Tax=Diversispora epigaea TaxID=1348612 RepID=A0A397JFH0_9GLOM|nr:hypothetical protein Glove_64g101 [Diversispora epigaea]
MRYTRVYFIGDFSELLNDKKEYNVVIEIDKEENKKSFTNISVQIFKIILKYIYGGIVNFKDTDTKTIYELMVIANELELKELSRKLESYLIESKASWLRTHFSLIYHSIFNSNEFKDLKNFYNDIIVKYPNLIFDSGDFASLKETALVSILKRDDLKQYLPLIRYFHIPGEIIWKKIKPYKNILEEQLLNDIIQHSMSSNEPITSLILLARIISYPELPLRAISNYELPSRTIPTPELPSRVNEPFSTIINKGHVAELSSWIDQNLLFIP